MAKYTNQNGTNGDDILDFTQTGIYHAYKGNDLIDIKGGSIVLYIDSGKNAINISGGSKHTIKVALDNKTSDTINGDDELVIDGANAVDAYLGGGKDEVEISNSNGKKSDGSLSQIHGGAWGDDFFINSGASNYQIYGDAGDDNFYINSGSNMNFWGGAANDRFIVYGGTNNKLYGGDSADYFSISANEQTIILGYGADEVWIKNGDKHQIKANLGNNIIYLKAGYGHVITADIDRAASKKKGYTDEQINAGEGVGYGVDNLKIDGATKVTAHLGDGRDYVSVSSGSGHEIYTEGWNDTIDISGTTSYSLFDAGTGDDVVNITAGYGNKICGEAGNDVINIRGGNYNEFVGGTGSDTYNITWTIGNEIYIDTSDYIAGDREKINIDLDKSAFKFVFQDNSLVLNDKNGGSIKIKLMDGITNSANFDGINFNGEMLTATKINQYVQNSAANAMLGFSESSLTANAGANSFAAQLNDSSDRKMFVTGNK